MLSVFVLLIDNTLPWATEMLIFSSHVS